MRQNLPEIKKQQEVPATCNTAKCVNLLYLDDVNDQEWQEGEWHANHVEKCEAHKSSRRC